ncbi:aspartyl protease family protein [Croceibacterium sp. TMG7-5b_MA50]|uniref:aspartyl protease family protein n=1 Tax=Croceibacterium sp. TMG7-5b_MA50 TaxID=3121290 RepID=UPI00322183F1
MRVLALTAGLVLGLGIPALAQEPIIATPAPAPAAELMELGYDRHSRPTLPVMIGDAGPYSFLIDTGAQATVLSRELADALALFDRRPATLIGMASRVTTHTVALTGLGIGQRRTDVPRAVLVDGQNIGGTDGVLGLDALQGQRVLFDFVRRTMSIAAAGEARSNRGYEIVVRARARAGQLIITDATVEGVRTAIVIDTGAQLSVGNAALARRLRAQQVEQTELSDINGTLAYGHLHVAERAEVGRLAMSKVPIVFAQSPAFQALDLEDRPAMFLGMRELRLLRRVAIDFRSRRILFDVPTSDREIAEAWARLLEP